MSSHREAPEISKDPAADNTDVYAWVDPTTPTKVNLVCNFNPFEIPYGGPNFAEFADDVLYTINVANAGEANPDISYQFRFTTTIVNPNTFLYNVGPIGANGANWNRPQTYSLTKVVRAADGSTTSTVLGTNLSVPPCNVGERSTPDYEATYGPGATHTIGNSKVFAGQRADAFFVDLGSVFDLAGLRPLNEFHAIPLPVMQGMNGLQGLNCHTLALQVPITELSLGGTTPSDPKVPTSVIGVWGAAYRNRGRLFDSATGTYKSFGEPVQVSRLANPLFNEVVNPMAVKDKWNSVPPSADKAFEQYVDKSELAGLVSALYGPAFPNLKAFNAETPLRPRKDLNAILLTGIPAGVVDPNYSTYTGDIPADLLRLNLAIAPTAVGDESPLGVLGGDFAGFPNGRRPLDDVTTIELRAIAGATIPLVYPTYMADAVLATDLVRDGTSNTNPPLMDVFPYLGTPNNGYAVSPPTASAGSGAPAPTPKSAGTAATGSASSAAAPAAGAPLASAAAASPGKAKAKKKHGTKKAGAKASKKRGGRSKSGLASKR